MLALTLGCATATVFSGALTSPAVAAPAGTAAKSPLDSCVQVAGERKLEKWSCLGGQLSWETTEKGQDGSARQVAHVERIAAEVADVPTAITADDYDYWCENGSTCTRKISNYISETKGNGAYGDSHGTIGNHDLIIRTSLNGRQANWNVSVIWDGGPTIYFSNFNVNCREDQFGPDPNCGVFRAIGNGNYVGPSRTRVNSGTIYGNRLNDSDPYYAQLGGYFTPDGYPRFTFGTLNTARWNCFGTSNCVFP
jgi:hypothetical protein